MCGQFAILGNLKAIKDFYKFLADGDFTFDDVDYFNVEPMGIDMNLPQRKVYPKHYVPVVGNQGNKIMLRFARWGLVPHWAKDDKNARHAINARIETIQEKPTFRDAYKRSRCLVPMSGFYEWGEDKQLHYYENPDNKFQSFAGLLDYWQMGQLTTFTICTTAGGNDKYPEVARIPIVLNEMEAIQWLKNGTVTN